MPLPNDHSILTRAELAKLQSFKSPKRQAEFYYTRVLWRNFGINEVISYNHAGRPFLQNGHISISHSRNIIAIAYHAQHPVGVDVEYHSAKLRKIKHKFISPEDEQGIDIRHDSVLTLVWSIKEAVYKMEQIAGLSFKDHIHVKLQNSEARVDVIKEREIHHYTFEMMDCGEYVLTYCSHANLNGRTLF